MSRLGHITLPFADGRYDFFLGIKQLDELDEKTGVGPGVLFARLCNGQFHSQDIRQVIRLGLIGKGLAANQALTLVERYVDPPVPLFESLPIAVKIMEAALHAPEDASKKKPAAPGKRKPRTIPPDASTSPSSMATAP